MDEAENMLYQMMLHTREDFRAAQLRVSPKAPAYFNSNCKHSSLYGILVDSQLSIHSGQLKKNPDVFDWPIKERVNDLSGASDEETTATANLIERCLRLSPAHRSTATELLSDRWFDGVD